jgi:hypothetical protein
MALSEFLTGAGDALQDALLEREVRRRQAMLDDLKRRETDSQIAEREADQRLRQQTEARMLEALRQTRELQEAGKRQARAQNLAQTMLPGEATEDAANLLDEFGYSGIIRKTPGVRVPLVAARPAPQPAEGEIPMLDRVAIESQVTPDQFESLGGFAYQQARTAAAERASQAEGAQAAAADRAASDRESREQVAREANQTRELVAGIAASGRNQNADLQREILQGRIDAQNEKTTAAKEGKDRARAAQIRGAQDTLAVVDQLIDKSGKLTPGGSQNFGARIPGMSSFPGTDAANYAAALDRLKGRLIVDLLGELKSQSRTGATGFGALSERELSLLESAASSLNNPNQTEASARTELQRIREMVSRVLQEPATGNQSGSVKRYNPQTGRVE